MRKGFSIIEIMIVIGVFALLFAVGLPIGLDAYRNYILNTETANLVSYLRRAQNMSFSNTRSSPHGVYVSNNNFVVFEGSSYATRNSSYDEQFSRTSSVNIAGLSEIIFSPLSGKPIAQGSFVLSNLLNVQTININEQGAIIW